VIAQLPTFAEVRRQLIRRRSQHSIPVPDPQRIPAELRTTPRGRSVADDDVNHAEPFLMYEGQNGKLMVFCAKTELELLHQSEDLIGDETFEIVPESSYQ